MGRALNILDFDAIADGKTVCTKQIQRAIDLCEESGTVCIPKGVFRSGALYLKSNMTLHLEEGATLLGSDNIEDYPLKGYPFEGLDQLCYASLINVDGARYENITISGKGCINANGVALFRAEMDEARGKRGRAIFLRNVKNLVMEGVTIRQSPAWCVHLAYCENVSIRNVEIHTKFDENGRQYPHIFNGDGIDVDACQNVVIEDSYIASQDDCIAIKSGRNEEGRRVGIPSKNIVIRNCKFYHGFGVAVGSEMSGGVEDVLVKNCSFTDSFSIASLKAIRGRGAYIRNVRYENCSLVNRNAEVGVTKWFRGALYMDGFYGMDEFDADKKETVDETTPVIEDVCMKDISVETVAGHAIYLCGLPESTFKNVTLENVTAHGEYGIKTKNIENLKLINVKVTSDKE